MKDQGYPVEDYLHRAVAKIERHVPPEAANQIEYLKSLYSQFVKQSFLDVRDAPSGEMLFLLSEVPTLEKKRRLESAVKSTINDKSKCLWVAPFKSQEEAQNVLWNLADVGVNGKIKEREVVGDKSYWVYVSPRVSRERAMSIVEQLKGESVECVIIAAGELANGISLGIFGKQEKAARLRQVMREKNYPAEIREISRNKKIIGIEISEEESALISEDWWEKLGEEYPTIHYVNQMCLR